MAAVSYAEGSDAARELIDYACELSESYTSAGWLIGLEEMLWSAVGGVANRYEIPVDKLLKLLHLAAVCASWPVFTKEFGEGSVPLSEWVKEHGRS